MQTDPQQGGFCNVSTPFSVHSLPAGRDAARGKSWDVVDFCRVAKIHDPPRTPSGPRLAVQAAGPATRPGEAEVTFPRCDALPGSTDGRLFSLNINKVDNIPFAAAS